jgi:hypothetical protein
VKRTAENKCGYLPKGGVILGEPFAVYHAVGLTLVLGGIGLAERKQP